MKSDCWIIRSLDYKIPNSKFQKKHGIQDKLSLHPLNSVKFTLPFKLPTSYHLLLVFGIWCSVFGIRYLVFGIWCLVFGI